MTDVPAGAARRSSIAFQWVPSRVWEDGWEVQILVNGQDFIDVVRAWEKPVAAAVGEAKLAGSYAGMPEGYAADLLSWWGGTSTREAGVMLLACGDCGVPGCWPLRARIAVQDDEVVWHAFEQPYRRSETPDPLTGRAGRGGWSYAGFGPFVFEREAYLAALQALGSSPR